MPVGTPVYYSALESAPVAGEAAERLDAPQASEAVRKEDVATVLHFIFEHFGKPFNACDLPGYVVAAVRRLEHAALSAQPGKQAKENDS